MEKYNLEHQWQMYLKKSELNEDQMHDIQKQETKRAFMGGVGQMLTLMTTDLVNLPDEDVFKKLDDLIDQVASFWLSEVKEQSKRINGL